MNGKQRPTIETERLRLRLFALDDAPEVQRLCSPDSRDFILDLPDYYAFFTYTMFWGKVS